MFCAATEVAFWIVVTEPAETVTREPSKNGVPVVNSEVEFDAEPVETGDGVIP